jgi:hypothetical protein
MSNANPKLAASVVAIVAGLLLVSSYMDRRRPSAADEYELIDRIQESRSDAERSRLISELDGLPVRIKR